MSQTAMASLSMPYARTPDHAGTSVPPAPLAGERKYRIAAPALAERSHRHDWPDELQRLQRACRAAWDVYAELDELAVGLPPDSPLARLALSAWRQWLAVEEVGALALEGQGAA